MTNIINIRANVNIQLHNITSLQQWDNWGIYRSAETDYFSISDQLYYIGFKINDLSHGGRFEDAGAF